MKRIMRNLAITVSLAVLGMLFCTGIGKAFDKGLLDGCYYPIRFRYLLYVAEYSIIGLSAAWFLKGYRSAGAVRLSHVMRLTPAVAGVLFSCCSVSALRFCFGNTEGMLRLAAISAIYLLLSAAICFSVYLSGKLLIRLIAWDTAFGILSAICLTFAGAAMLTQFGYGAAIFVTAVSPAAVYLIAERLAEKARDGGRCAAHRNAFCFLSAIIILLLPICLDFTYHVKYGVDLFDTAHVLFIALSCAFVIWYTSGESFSKFFFTFKGRRITESPLLWTALMSLTAVVSRLRLYEVIDSLYLPAEAIPDTYGVSGYSYGNWIAYRLAVLRDNVAGCFDSMRIFSLENVPEDCSIAWLRSACGIWTAIAAVAVLAALLILLYRAARSGGRFSMALYGVLLAKTAVGLLNNLFLFLSAEMTPMMLGYRPIDLILVILILAADTSLGKGMGDKASDTAPNGKSSADDGETDEEISGVAPQSRHKVSISIDFDGRSPAELFSVCIADSDTHEYPYCSESKVCESEGFQESNCDAGKSMTK